MTVQAQTSILASTLVLVLILASGLGCRGTEETIEYINATGKRIEVTVDGSFVFSLEPGQRHGYRTRDVFLPDRVQACSGDALIHDETITWEELKNNDFTYVIDGTLESPPDPSRPPQQSAATFRTSAASPC